MQRKRAETDLAPWKFDRREVGPHDVQFDILIAAFATPTCTRSKTIGSRGYSRWFRATKLWAA